MPFGIPAHYRPRRTGNGLPLADWIAWSEVRDARLSRAGLDAILSLLAEKESRLCDPPPDTPLMPLDAGPGDVRGEVAE
ncbi:MAG: hypothetical protein IIA40_01030 [SAR324 cluster bacterium]|nr:hypothetical protein [SAR324 cluster bacterium]